MASREGIGTCAEVAGGASLSVTLRNYGGIWICCRTDGCGGIGQEKDTLKGHGVIVSVEGVSTVFEQRVCESWSME